MYHPNLVGQETEAYSNSVTCRAGKGDANFYTGLSLLTMRGSLDMFDKLISMYFEKIFYPHPAK